MSNTYKNKVLSKAKQNRTNRVVRTAKEYDKKVSKSQQAYVAGDLISSASKKAYGYKKYGTPEQSWITGGRSKSNYKKLQEGKNPYEGKYYYDGKKRTVTNTDGSKFTSRKRFLTDDEKESLKTTGDINVSNYKKNYKYAILRGVDGDGKNYDSHFNLLNKDGSMKWDGMNVAKNKVRAGGSKLNYLGGFLKDTVVDSGVDFLKRFDRYESGAIGAGLGIAENVQDVADSITGGDFSFKNVDLSRAKKNWNESMDEANKTGWGHSAGHYLKGMSQRNDDQMYDYLLKTKGKESADAYKKTEKKVQKAEDIINTGLGIGLDFANPAQLGSAFVKTLGKAGKLTVKSGKDLLKGTADISTGFKSGGVLDVLTNQGPLAKTNKRGSMLNQEYDRVMSKTENVKQVIKSNPKTQNLGHFLDEIGESVDSGVQRGFDGRTLNKKYTQINGDYVPQTIRGEEIPTVKENNLDGQLNMLDDMDRISQPSTVKNADEALYFKTISRFSDNIDSIIKDVEDMPVDKADRFYDWVEKNDPDLFYKLNDTVVPDIEREINKLNLSNLHKPSEINKSYLSNPEKKSKLDIFNDSIEKNKELAKNYEEINKARLLAEQAGKSAPIPPRKSYTELKDNFTNFGKQVQEQLSKGDYTFVNKLQNTMQNIDIKKLAKSDNYKMEVIEKLNKELFSDDLIKSNIDKGNLTSFVEHLDDVLNYNLTKQSGGYSFNPKGTYRGTKKGTHHMYDRNNNPNEISLNTSFFSPSLLDMNYKDKLSFADNLVGIKSKSELDAPIKELEKVMKKHGFELLSPKEKALYKSMKKEYGNATQALEQKMTKLGFDKLSPSEQREYKSLTNRLDIRNKAYAEVSNMDDADFLAHKSKYGKGTDVGNYDLEDNFEKGFGGNRKDFVDKVQNEKNIKSQTADKSYQGGDLTTGELKEYEQAEKALKDDLKYSESIATANKFKAEQVQKLAKEIGIELPSTKKVVVKLGKNQTITSLPPVQKSFESLKKIVQNEVAEMVKSPGTYKTKAKHYSELKKSFVNSLRAYGVPDNAYFNKLTNLKETLYEMEKNARKGVRETPLDKAVKGGEGGSGTPKNGMNMNLQLLAKKIDEMFDEFGSKNIDELSKDFIPIDEFVKKEGFEVPTKVDENVKDVKEYEEIAGGNDILSDFWSKINKEEPQLPSKAIESNESVSNNPLDKLVDNITNDAKNPLDDIIEDDYINGFDEFNQLDNIRQSSKSQEKISDAVPKKSSILSEEEIAKIDKTLERYKEHGDVKNFDDVDEFNAFRDSLDGKTQKQVDKLFNSSNPNNPPTFEKFKKFFTEKSVDTKIGYEDGGLYKAYKAWLNTWKKGLTVYNPGWHLQNFFQNKGQNYLGIGMDAFGSQKNAKNVLSYMNGVDKGAYELVSKNGKVYTKSELAKLAKNHNVAEGMATNTTKSNGVFPWLEGKADNSSIMKKALQSEQTARLHHFLTQLERGMSPEDASKSVNKYLFDYAHKTKADKVMSDFVDPFWSFHKSNAKLLTTAPFKHPSEVNKILRVNRELDENIEDDKKVPNEFREHQSPYGSFKDDMNGDTYNYFYDENMLPNIDESLPIEGDDLENKLNPLLRIALQQSRNEGNFGNKLVDKDKAGYDETTKDERKWEVARELNPVMNPLVKAYYKSKEHQKKTDEGKQTQSTTDTQKLMELLAYAFGNKGNYYRDNR